ncbi:hypothetical protein [Streptomyces sp. NPDC059491]|uniref:hypothetical protein n=1 Tax=unclassified Streptomyces TaxID=2593676 RepID=UPI0036B1FD1B
MTCSTAACRMPPRSRDINALRLFAHQHAHAHARLAAPRPGATCACAAAECRYHANRATCVGRNLLLLIHNRLVGDVWTLAEVCQGCAPHITHTTVLTGATAPPGTSAPAPRTPPPAPVQVTFSSEQAAGPDDAAALRRSQRPPRSRQNRGNAGRRTR